MFCKHCGQQIDEKIRFCPNCGTPTNDTIVNPPSRNVPGSTPFVPAKCPNCGAALKVDPNREAAVCQYCNTPYIVEKAISNYNISVSGNLQVGHATINFQGENISNLNARAREYELKGDLVKALQYYNKVLDSDVSNVNARNGISRIKSIAYNMTFFETDARVFLKKGRLRLLYGSLIFIDNKGEVTSYPLNKLNNVKWTSQKTLQFTIDDKFTPITYNVAPGTADTWSTFIKNAQHGLYPGDLISMLNRM